MKRRSLPARGFVTIVSLAMTGITIPLAGAADSGGDVQADIAALRADNERLRSLIPSQSHAMMDVAYHFTNLWFAGKRRNWPLAQFYFNESRSHIQWAVRIVPVRRTSHGEVKLDEMFTAFDGTLLTDLKGRIAAKDGAGFEKAYRAALEGCNACHTASDKPFLHVHVPDAPEVHIIDFKPQGGASGKNSGRAD